MDYPKEQNKDDVPWWERTPDPEATRDRLIEQIEAMQTYHREVPKSLFIKQGVALVYIVVNLLFMYSNISNSHVGYIGAYMIPQLIIFMDYFLVVKKLKDSYKQEEKQ